MKIWLALGTILLIVFCFNSDSFPQARAKYVSPAPPKAASDQVPALSEADFEKLKVEAQSNLDNDKIPEAIKIYSRLVQMRPACAECWWYLGTLNYYRENFLEAGRVFSRFVQLEPGNGQGWGFWGISEFKTKQFGPALNHLTKARELGLGENEELKAAVRYHQAVLLNQGGNFELAREILIKGFAGENRESESIFLALGMAELRIPNPMDNMTSEQREMARQFGKASFLGYSGRIPAAAALYDQLVEKYRGKPNVAYAYGVALSEGQEHEKAMQFFRRELERDPNHLAAMLQIAWILVMQAKYKEAAAYVQKGLLLDPLSFPAVYLNGRILLAEQKVPEAITALEEAVKLAPDSANAYFSLLQAYKRADRLADAEKAQKIFERLTKDQSKPVNSRDTSGPDTFYGLSGQK